MFYPPGWADDGVGLELVVEPWLDGLWPRLLSMQEAGPPSGIPVLSPTNQCIEPSPAQQTVSSPADVEPTLGAESSRSPLLEAVNSLSDQQCRSSLRYSRQLSAAVLDLPARPLDFLAVAWLDRDPEPVLNAAKFPLADGPVLTAAVVENRTLSQSGALKTYKQIDVSLGEIMFDCLPGDTIGVICSNPMSEVEELGRLLGLAEQLDMPLAVTVMADTKKARAKVPEFLPRESRLRDLLAGYLDLRAVPKKLMLRAMVDHTSDVRERRRLEELCSKQVNLHFLFRHRGFWIDFLVAGGRRVHGACAGESHGPGGPAESLPFMPAAAKSAAGACASPSASPLLHLLCPFLSHLELCLHCGGDTATRPGLHLASRTPAREGYAKSLSQTGPRVSAAPAGGEPHYGVCWEWDWTFLRLPASL